MQTLILAKRILGTRIVRLSDDSAFTRALPAGSAAGEADRETFLRVLSRPPSGEESRMFTTLLRPHYAGRIVKDAAASASMMKRIIACRGRTTELGGDPDPYGGGAAAADG